MVNEVGLNGPPPPEIVMLALAIGLQLGPGDGLGDGLMPGDGLGLGDGLMPGDGLGDGLGPWASVTVAPALKKSTPMMRTTHWIQSGCFTCRCGKWFNFAA
jgi:hypothetical protein